MVKLFSMNVNGWNNFEKRRQTFLLLREKKGDIFFIQETFCTSQKEKIWRNEWGGKAFFSNGESNSRGVAILYNRNSDIEIKATIRDLEGRCIINVVKIADKELALCNIYAPNESNPNFFKGIVDMLRQTDTREWIIGGDFNLVLNPQLDRKSQRTPVVSTSSEEAVREMMREHDLVDIFRTLHPNLERYTWHGRAKRQGSASRLDFFLISDSLVQEVQKAEIDLAYRSDHSMIRLELRLDLESRGKGFWKMNASLLRDQEYVQGMLLALQNAKNKNDAEHLNPGLSWEMIKNTIVSERPLLTQCIKLIEIG